MKTVIQLETLSSPCSTSDSLASRLLFAVIEKSESLLLIPGLHVTFSWK